MGRNFVATIQADVSGGIPVYKSGLGFYTVEKSNEAVEKLKEVPQVVVIAHSLLVELDEPGKTINLPNGEKIDIKPQHWETRIWARASVGVWELVALPQFEP